MVMTSGREAPFGGLWKDVLARTVLGAIAGDETGPPAGAGAGAEVESPGLTPARATLSPMLLLLLLLLVVVVAVVVAGGGGWGG